MTFQPRINTGMPGYSSLPKAKIHVAGAAEGASTIVRPVVLDYGNLLRIRNGRGTRVHAASGVLWITEEDSPEDHVLMPGDAIDLTETGMAIVFAERRARVVVEVPTGVTPPRAVDMVRCAGTPGVRIVLATPTTVSLSMIVGGVARRVIARAAAAIRAMVETQRPNRNAVQATAVPRKFSNMREVERVVIDDWTMRRM